MNRIIKNRIICCNNGNQFNNNGNNNQKNTIKNLNKVLGVEELKQESLKIVKKIDPITIEELQEEIKFDYLKFAELINGRCASLAILLGKIEYTNSGHNMYTQLTTQVDTNIFYLLFNFSILSCITLITIDQLKEENMIVEVEDFFHKFNMLIWLVNIPVICYYYNI